MASVADLFARLGLDIDKPAFAAADAFLDRLRMSTKALAAETAAAMAGAAANARHFDHVVLGTARAARGAVDDAAVSWDGWNKQQRKAIDWGRVWGRTMRVATGAAIGGFVAVHAVKSIANLGDAYTSAGNRIRQLTDDTAQQKRIQDALFASAQNAGSDFGDVVTLYQQVGKAAVDNGRTLEQGVTLTDTLGKAIKASGATAVGAAAALQQLGQGLGANALRGQEFNSIIEQAPFLIDILAKDLGKTRGEMRKMAEAGKLTAKVVLGAFERQKGAVDAAFAKRVPLITDGFARMRNEVSKTFGEMLADKKTAEAFTVVIKAMSVALVGLIKGLAAVIVFAVNHKKTMLALAAALAAPFVGLAVGIALALAPFAAIALATVKLIKLAKGMGGAFGRAITAVGRRFTELGRGIRRVAESVKTFFVGVADTVRGVFQTVINWIAGRINWVVDKVNWLIRQINRLPGIDIGSLGHVGSTAAVAPAERAAGIATGATTTIENNVTVQAANEPGAVASAATGAMQAFWDAKMRGTGIA